jgi:hypothetical protein
LAKAAAGQRFPQALAMVGVPGSSGDAADMSLAQSASGHAIASAQEARSLAEFVARVTDECESGCVRAPWVCTRDPNALCCAAAGEGAGRRTVGERPYMIALVLVDARFPTLCAHSSHGFALVLFAQAMGKGQ